MDTKELVRRIEAHPGLETARGSKHLKVRLDGKQLCVISHNAPDSGRDVANTLALLRRNGIDLEAKVERPKQNGSTHNEFLAIEIKALQQQLGVSRHEMAGDLFEAQRQIGGTRQPRFTSVAHLLTVLNEAALQTKQPPAILAWEKELLRDLVDWRFNNMPVEKETEMTATDAPVDTLIELRATILEMVKAQQEWLELESFPPKFPYGKGTMVGLSRWLVEQAKLEGYELMPPIHRGGNGNGGDPMPLDEVLAHRLAAFLKAENAPLTRVLQDLEWMAALWEKRVAAAPDNPWETVYPEPVAPSDPDETPENFKPADVQGWLDGSGLIDPQPYSIAIPGTTGLAIPWTGPHYVPPKPLHIRLAVAGMQLATGTVSAVEWQNLLAEVAELEK